MIGNHAILRENTENTGKKNRFRISFCYTYQQKICHMQIGIRIRKRCCVPRRNKNKYKHKKKNILLFFVLALILIISLDGLWLFQKLELAWNKHWHKGKRCNHTPSYFSDDVTQSAHANVPSEWTSYPCAFLQAWEGTRTYTDEDEADIQSYILFLFSGSETCVNYHSTNIKSVIF